ncbi:hypothetical protein [Myxococcus virescens]|uniref:Uncharacterized protein n=1 Tax=Myxococcus virescens TaxID=83456 RepID=A0A511HPN0_9BACT|nr:hypothetical protein [Myxococcus virescens]GEL75557.1 hypothetical protein MVI01_73410 [Myxococcus virescens]SDE65173.1 hypothetical protein SAMN04488504_109277 [Myxococcus virescens]
MLMGHALRQRFWLERLLVTNARGEHEYAEPELHACRYQGTMKRIVTTDGEERVAAGLMYCAVEVRPEDRVYPPGTSPDDEDAGKPPIHVVTHVNLMGAVDHYEVYL